MRQGELFSGAAGLTAAATWEPSAPLQAPQLQRWQQDLLRHQAPLFVGAANGAGQGDLFEAATGGSALFNPLDLRPQALSFWRWPQAPQQGAALYFVMDSVTDINRPATHGTGAESDRASGNGRTAQPLLLYVGETGQADRRWKGEHDCKGYLAAYSEALNQAGLSCRLSIRFWLDVPSDTRARRALEQQLIQHWLPPFNKETRQRWATPFTALADGG